MRRKDQKGREGAEKREIEKRRIKGREKTEILID